MSLAAGLFLRAGPIAVLGLGLISACTVVVEEPRPAPRPGPSFCTREFQPVCAVRGGERRTFANACFADRAGFHIIRRGECTVSGGMSGPPRACTMEYNPVCGRRGDRLRTFGNRCEAEAAGFRVIERGAC